MTVRKKQTAKILPQGKGAPEPHTNDSLGLHSAHRQAGVPVGILGCNGGGYRQRRIPQPVSDFT